MCRNAFRRDKQSMVMLFCPVKLYDFTRDSKHFSHRQDRSRLKPLLQGHILSLDFPWASPVYLIGSHGD